MFRDEVTVQDAITAVLAVDSSSHTSSIVNNFENVLHTKFPDNPDLDCKILISF